YAPPARIVPPLVLQPAHVLGRNQYPLRVAVFRHGLLRSLPCRNFLIVDVHIIFQLRSVGSDDYSSDSYAFSVRNSSNDSPATSSSNSRVASLICPRSKRAS